MKIGILKYPGGHGEFEWKFILSSFFSEDARLVWYSESNSSDVDLLILGGGFPCKESETGLNCLQGTMLREQLLDLAARGKYILGVGNGFQILCEAGLLPGTLERNNSGKFICKYLYVKPENYSGPLTHRLPQERIFRLPIATMYGKYTADTDTVIRMREQGQILFRYCNYEGKITEAVNSTGSLDNIAVICNTEKNVFGMIPQPERAVAEFMTEADGKLIIGSFLQEMSV